nr:polysaccharide biosynthesis C-terminal domain-containing protein [Hufsiella ginkgonis]
MLYSILTPVFTTAYSAGVYAIFTNLYSWASLIGPLLAFGMETTFFRFLNKQESEKQQVYNNTFISVASLVFLFFISTIFFARDIAAFLQSGVNLDDYTNYVRYFIVILCTDSLAVIPFAKLRADGRPFRYSLIKFTNILLQFLLNLVFIFVIPFIIDHHWAGGGFLASWYRHGWIGYVFIANLAASVLTLLMLLPEVMQVKPDFSRSLSLKMLSYSFPVLVANLSFIVNETFDKIMMTKLLPVQQQVDVGIYGACAKISIFLSIFINAFRLGAEPFFFSHAKNKNSGETYSRIMDYFIIVVCVIYVGIVGNIEILKHFIHARNAAEQAVYWSGLPVVPILLFGYVSLGIYINLSIWYKLSDQTRYGLYISGTGAILTIILNFIFIPKHSYMAAAWVSVTAYTTMMVLSYLLGQKNYPIPYRTGKNIIYLVSSIVLAYLSFVVLKQNIFAGNALTVAYLAAIWFAERKELKKLWKTI